MVTSHLTKDQKKAFGLLGVGTFLEFFDLMLYIQMAVLLNDLFFPVELQVTNPNLYKFFRNFSLCSSFLFRPLGAIILGWIGDNIGRKATIIITTFVMATCCGIMVVVPTYQTIGISSSIIVTCCRIFQGMSSIGEIIGAELYLFEISKPPIRYFLVSMVTVTSYTGGLAALAMATFISIYDINWRYAFAFGLCVALIGIFARTVLRESSDFLDAKKKLKIYHKQFPNNSNNDNSYCEEVEDISLNKKTFFLYCCFFFCPSFIFTYIFCTDLMKGLGIPIGQILKQNLYVQLISTLYLFFLSYLTYYIHPLKLIRMRFFISLIFVIFSFFFFEKINCAWHVFLMQLFVII